MFNAIPGWRAEIQKILRTKDFTLPITDDELDRFIADARERWNNPYEPLQQRYSTFEICVAELLRERGQRSPIERAT